MDIITLFYEIDDFFLQEDGMALIYKVRRNMEPEPISETDAALLKQRMLIESVNKELKSQTEIQHTP